MQNNNDQLDSLEYKLKTLSSHQAYINTELNRIREEIEALKENRNTGSVSTVYEKPVAQEPIPAFPQPVPAQQAVSVEKKIFSTAFVPPLGYSTSPYLLVQACNSLNIFPRSLPFWVSS